MRPRALVLLFALAACSEQNVNLGGNYEVASFVPPIENRDIDLLFVVDSSPSMIDNQAAIVGKAREALFDVIDSAVGGMPDLHIGVITPDMDLGIPNGDPFCDNGGDNGALLVPAGCAGFINGNFIIDLDDGSGGRITNYAGSLDSIFECMVQVGTDGCGFEQHFEATRTALTNPLNAGFLRDEALLVVVFLTDEDDCSGAPELYDPDPMPLGPLRSYRCFQHAVTCAEPLDVVGPKTDCEARDDNPLFLALDALEQDLIAAKDGDPTKVMVAAIAGDSEPVEVVDNAVPPLEPGLTLLPSCMSDSGDTAAPALRLESFLGRFPGRSWFESICAPVDLALRRTANLIGDLAGRRPCLRGTFKDTDADTDGVQPSCRVFLVDAPFTAAEARREVPACDGDDADACFRIAADAPTCAHWDGFAVELVGAQQAPTENLIVECLTP